MNPMDMMKLANMWSGFKERHPKIPLFFNKASQSGALRAGTVLELTIRTEEGKHLTANMKLTPEDAELFKQMGEMRGRRV